MKTTNPTSPSTLTCRVVRLWSSVAQHGDGAGHHVATCPACREFFASAVNLEQALRQDAAPQVAAPSGRFEDDVMRAIRTSTPDRRSRRHPLAGYALLGSAAALAAVFVVEFRPSQKAGTPPAVATGEYPAEAAQLANAMRAFPENLRGLEQPAATFAQNNPLQREVQNVYSDAQSALAFLKLNFLPGTAAAEGQPSST